MFQYKGEKKLRKLTHAKVSAANNITASGRMALIDPLLKTTGSPIWVHPLLWSLDHLDRFGVSVQHIGPQITDPPIEGQTTASSRSTKGRLKEGYIGSRHLKYILQDIELLETYLAAFLVRTINTFQKSLRPKPFRYFSQE